LYESQTIKDSDDSDICLHILHVIDEALSVREVVFIIHVMKFIKIHWIVSSLAMWRVCFTADHDLTGQIVWPAAMVSFNCHSIPIRVVISL